MKKVNLENYNYENRVLSFKSYIKEFTTDLYEEFNYKSEQIGLLSKINDLFDEKKVNFTEDQANNLSIGQKIRIPEPKPRESKEVLVNRLNKVLEDVDTRQRFGRFSQTSKI